MATSIESKRGLAPVNDTNESFPTAHAMSSTKQRIRRTGTSFKACNLTNTSEREPWAIRLSAQRRLAVAVAVSIAVYSIGPTVVPIANRLLVTWIAASLTYLALYWLTILRADADLTRRRATRYDQAAYVTFLLVTNAACASIVAIGFVMGDVKSLDFWPKALHVGLAIAALLLSWMLIHTVFAFHYARRYYAPASVREVRPRD